MTFKSKRPAARLAEAIIGDWDCHRIHVAGVQVFPDSANCARWAGIVPDENVGYILWIIGSHSKIAVRSAYRNFGFGSKTNPHN